jgi:RNA polymerase sigma-70 factor (ECF subfamily)
MLSPNPALKADFERELLSALPALRRFASHLCRNRDDADELLQSTAVLLLTHRARFEPGSNFIAWAKTIMRRSWIAECRREKTRRSIFVEMDRVRDLDGDEGETFEGVADGNPEQILVATQTFDAILRMKPIRAAILLDAATGLSHATMAEKFDFPINTVKSHLQRGRAQLATVTGGI